MKILFRERFDYTDEIERLGHTVSVMPKGVFFSSHDALVLHSPEPREIYDECSDLEKYPCKTKVIVVAPCYMYTAITSAFPSVSFINNESEAIATNIISEIKKEKEKEEGSPLTEREKRVLSKIAYGLCNKEICHELALSDRSLRRIKESIYRKTGLYSQEQLTIVSLFRFPKTPNYPHISGKE